MVGHTLGGTAGVQRRGSGAGAGPVGVEFVRTSEFWYQSFQNWQSEFLAVGSIVVLTIVLRQRGSAESKPVHAPHRQTGNDKTSDGRTDGDRRGKR